MRIFKNIYKKELKKKNISIPLEALENRSRKNKCLLKTGPTTKNRLKKKKNFLDKTYNKQY